MGLQLLGYEPKTISSFNNLQDAGAIEKPCKERKRTLIGQSQDRRVSKELSALVDPTTSCQIKPFIK